MFMKSKKLEDALKKQPEPVEFNPTDEEIQEYISAWDGDITEQQARYLLEINFWKGQVVGLTAEYATLKESFAGCAKCKEQYENEVNRLKERLHQHEGVEGGISAKCGHPIQCLYAAAKVDGGPVCCFVCDMKKKIDRMIAENAKLKKEIGDLRAKAVRKVLMNHGPFSGKP